MGCQMLEWKECINGRLATKGVPSEELRVNSE